QRPCAGPVTSGCSLRWGRQSQNEIRPEDSHRVRIELAHLFAIGGSPGGNVASEIGGEDALAVLTEGGAERKFVEEFEFPSLCAVGVPKCNIVVAAASDKPAIAAVTQP